LANITLKVTGTPGSYSIDVQRTGADSTRARGTFTRTGDMVSLYFDLKTNPTGTIRLSGYISNASPITLTGSAILPDGTATNWSATYTGAATAAGDKAVTPKPNLTVGPVVYPFAPFGNAELPTAETVLFKNATVWTNEKDGILKIQTY